MKRIFTISVAAVMALLMVLSLTACGNSTLGYYKLTSAEASGMSFDSSNSCRCRYGQRLHSS